MEPTARVPRPAATPAAGASASAASTTSVGSTASAAGASTTSAVSTPTAAAASRAAAAPFTAIVIDFFGTLTTSAPDHLWLQAAAASAAPLGLPAAQWRDVLTASFVERATGALGDLTETFRVLARRCGIEPSEAALAEACAARVAAQNALFVFRSDAVAALAALRTRGYRLGLLSDCTPELPVAWPELAVAPYFDTAVFSCVEGVKKPAAAFFRLVATASAWPPPSASTSATAAPAS